MESCLLPNMLVWMHYFNRAMLENNLFIDVGDKLFLGNKYQDQI